MEAGQATCIDGSAQSRHGSRMALAAQHGQRQMRTSPVRLASRRALSSKHRPANVVPQPLVVKYELANRLREPVTLPLALESRCDLTLALRRGSTCSLDRTVWIDPNAL